MSAQIVMKDGYPVKVGCLRKLLGDLIAYHEPILDEDAASSTDHKRLTKKDFNFKKVKARRKMQAKSRKINRR